MASSTFSAAAAVAIALAVATPAESASVRVQLATLGGGLTLNTSVTSIKEMRERDVVIQRYDYSCGSAALATILEFHFDHPVGEQQIVADMIRRGDVEKIIRRKGFSLLDMKRFAERLGYEAAGYRMDFEDLVAFDTPVVVPIVINDYRHFVVFKGADRDRVYIADPAYGNRTLPIYEFVEAWTDFQRVGLVITRARGAATGSRLEVEEEDAIYIGNRHFQPALRGIPSLFTHNPLAW